MSTEILITGPGRSGTTLLAHCFYNAGYDLGNCKPENIGKPVQGGGLEDVQIKLMNHVLMEEKASGVPPEKSAEIHREEMRRVLRDSPQVIKSPSLIRVWSTWILAGVYAPVTIVSLRNLEELYRSYEYHKRFPPELVGQHEKKDFIRGLISGSESYYNLLYQQKNLLNPIEIIKGRYPNYCLVKDYCTRLFGKFFSWEVMQETFDRNLLHFT